MKILHPTCCGVDVHKKVIVACILQAESQPTSSQAQVRTFGTTWEQLLQFVEWLEEKNCRHIAMESTGVYWRPIFHLLEDRFEEVMIVNAQHIKAVPGRKTDVKDAQWIAELYQYGLLRPSFLPPRPQRELRELTRGRKQVVEERTRVVNRIHKTLEDTNIKLGSVVSDLMGKSARQMLWALLEDQPIHEIAAMGRGVLRSKQAELEQALQGELRDHHRFLIRQYLTHIDQLEAHIRAFDQEIARRIGQEPEPPSPSTKSQPQKEPTRAEREGEAEEVGEPGEERGEKQVAVEQQAASGQEGYEGYAHAIARLKGITGISERLAMVLVAEIGIDMDHFGSAERLASWIGLCPGNQISAGKRLGGKTTKGNIYVRTGLVEAAQAAARSQGTFLGALYRRLKPRLGHKRAIVALAHRIAIIVYAMLKNDEPYHEYGEQVVEDRLQEARKQRALHELHKQGYTVSLSESMSA